MPLKNVMLHLTVSPLKSLSTSEALLQFMFYNPANRKWIFLWGFTPWEQLSHIHTKKTLLGIIFSVNLLLSILNIYKMDICLLKLLNTFFKMHFYWICWCKFKIKIHKIRFYDLDISGKKFKWFFVWISVKKIITIRCV